MKPVGGGTFTEDGIEQELLMDITLLAGNEAEAKVICDRRAFELAVHQAKQQLAERSPIDEEMHEISGDFSRNFQYQGTTGDLFWVVDTEHEPVLIPADPHHYLEVTGTQPWVFDSIEAVT
jgi:hypothetical protein